MASNDGPRLTARQQAMLDALRGRGLLSSAVVEAKMRAAGVVNPDALVVGNQLVRKGLVEVRGVRYGPKRWALIV